VKPFVKNTYKNKASTSIPSKRADINIRIQENRTADGQGDGYLLTAPSNFNDKTNIA
jgi:hypothetical protein